MKSPEESAELDFHSEFRDTDRHRADGPFREILAFDSKSMIETSAIVLPGDSRRQFDQLCLRKTLPQTREECVGNFHRSSSHLIGVLEDEAL